MLKMYSLLIFLIFAWNCISSCQIEKDHNENSSDDLNVKFKNRSISINTKAAIQIPANFPIDIYIYNNAKIIKTDSTEKWFMISIRTEDKLKQILKIYKKKMYKEDWNLATENVTEKKAELNFEKWIRNVSITITQEKDSTTIFLKTQK